MNALLALTTYCVLIVLASLLGGWVPLLRRITHDRLQVYLSFSAGVMLGAAMLHMLPESFELAGAPAGGWALVGATVLLISERIFGFHQHELTLTIPELAAPHNPAERMSPAAALAGLQNGTIRRHGFMSGTVAAGLTLHALTAGLALASTTTTTGPSGLSASSFSVFLAILVHKPADAMTIATLLLCSGYHRRTVHLVNALYALAVPVGVGFFYAVRALVSDVGLAATGTVTGAMIAVTAGFLIVIALADVLPELQFHRHHRTRLAGAFLGGIAIMSVSAAMEAISHAH